MKLCSCGQYIVFLRNPQSGRLIPVLADDTTEMEKLVSRHRTREANLVKKREATKQEYDNLLANIDYELAGIREVLAALDRKK